jgi:peptide/nickel transport system substrate-binding protein
MTSMTKRVTALAVAVLAAGGLAACGKSATPSTGSSTSSASTPPSKPAGTLRIVATAGPDHIDTVPAYYTADYMLERAYTRQLLSYPYAVPTSLSSPGWTKATTPVADVATVVPSTSNGGITNSGKTYTFHIRPGVDWNTSPARQVTASDFIREFKAFSNPVSPVGNPLYYQSTIAGLTKYASQETAYFAMKSHKPTATNIANFQNTHTISGLSAPNPLTLKITLMAPASDFLYMMAMPFTSARPVEYDAYVPNSLQLDTHTISDGPYQITSYIAGKSLTMMPNPAWKQSTDPIRHQYVKEITETDGVASAQTQLADEQADTYDLVGADTPFEPTAIAGELAKKDPKFKVWPDSNTFPYVVFNLRSPNSGGAMGKLGVRQAVEYGLDKVAVQKVYGGPTVTQIINTAIPPGNTGYQNYNLYPDNNGDGNTAKCKSTLAAAGYPHGVSLTYLYPNDSVDTQVFVAIQASLKPCGINLKGKSEPGSSFFVDLGNSPENNKAGTWDMGQPGWFPDWFGNNGRTVISPLFQTNCVVNTNNYGCYNSTALDGIIKQAEAATTLSAAGALWHQADENVMHNAVIVPLLNQLQAYYSSTRVHNAGSAAIAFQPNIGGPDITNVWLSPSSS